MIQHIHHINIVVRDLDVALVRYQQLLGDITPIRADLPGRGVRTARFLLGHTWLVLLQPVADGAPARALAAHGEGVFLLSFGVDGLAEETEALRSRGITTDGPPRSGLADWKIVDLDSAFQPGLTVQICESAAESTR